MDAAPAAIPPKPKIAAIMATTRKIIVQRNMAFKILKWKIILSKTHFIDCRKSPGKSGIFRIKE